MLQAYFENKVFGRKDEDAGIAVRYETACEHHLQHDEEQNGVLEIVITERAEKNR